jgi:hypothetical protein
MKNIDFSRRNNLSQLMNSDDADFETFRAWLIDLAKVNYLTLAYRPTLRFFEHLARSGRLPTDRSITVIDVGSGFGDMLRNVDRWAVRARKNGSVLTRSAEMPRALSVANTVSISVSLLALTRLIDCPHLAVVEVGLMKLASNQNKCNGNRLPPFGLQLFGRTAVRRYWRQRRGRMVR